MRKVTGGPRPEPRVRFSEDRAEARYADFVTIDSTRNVFVISFGQHNLEIPGDVTGIGRIALPAGIVRKLADSLEAALTDHENQYGLGPYYSDEFND